MELINEFTVGVPLAQAWALLTDLERVVPCLPGAELHELEGEVYRGTVKVKVGPITTTYQGTAHFLERDATVNRAVVRAEGRETRGQGNAAATITATLLPAGTGTAVKVVTELSVTGKVAQFGRGVLAEVSTKLLSQFVNCLNESLAEGDPDPSVRLSWRSRPAETSAGAAPRDETRRGRQTPSGGSGTVGSSVFRLSPTPAEPVDILGLVAPSLRRRLPFAVAALGVLWLVIWKARRGKR